MVEKTEPEATRPDDPVTRVLLADGRGYRLWRVDYPPDYRQPLHAHATAGITVVLAGAIRETARRREELASALSVVVKPAGARHADTVGPRGARTVQAQLLDEDELLARTSADLGPWRWVHAGPGLRPMLELTRTAKRAGPDRALDLVYELLGEVTDSPVPVPGDEPPWLRRAREAIEDDTRRVPVAELAGEAGVHPVSLTRAFRRVHGIALTTYRRRVRLRRAAARIVGSDVPLSRVAHASGYADHPHLCREVKALSGMTPSSLRHLADPRTRR